MKYATYGNTGLKVSRLGFGVMRLPMNDDKTAKMDEGVAQLRRAYELGVNTFDSHHFYMGGWSEKVIGEALHTYPRDSYVIQTKHQMWADLEPGESYRGNLEESLGDLKTDYVDCYLMHSMTWERFELKHEAFLDEIVKAKDEGLVHHIGFSAHDRPENVKRLIDTGLFECMLVQYNYSDLTNEGILAYANAKGLGVSTMGPVGGGRLVSPNDFSQKFADGHHPVELALRFVLANDNVHTAFSGMNALEQVEQNVAVVENMPALTEADVAAIKDETTERRKVAELYCTGCNYCMPCPKDVNISGNFQALLWRKVYGIDERPQKMYDNLKIKDHGAVRCVACGQCVEKCPQKIDIPLRLKEVVETFDAQALEG